ncbi:MAG: YIP1 family protein [Actinomycetota bacterium]|nr:YIP1 family protein [Actinomycetota bacterium]
MAVIWAPVRVLREAASGRRVFAGFAVTVVYALLGLAGSVIAVLGGVTGAQLGGQPAPGLPPGTFDSVRTVIEVGVILSSVLTPFVVWISVSLIMQLVTRLFDGRGPLPAMLAVVGVSGVPLVLSAAVGVVFTGSQAALGAQSTAGVALGYTGGLLGLAAAVWFVVLVVVGASQARGLGYAESAGSCAVSCIGCAGLIILVMVVVGLGAVLLLGPAVSPSG